MTVWLKQLWRTHWSERTLSLLWLSRRYTSWCIEINTYVILYVSKQWVSDIGLVITFFYNATSFMLSRTIQTTHRWSCSSTICLRTLASNRDCRYSASVRKPMKPFPIWRFPALCWMLSISKLSMRSMPPNGVDVVGRAGKGVPGVSAGSGSGRKRPGCHPAFVGLSHPVICQLISHCYYYMTDNMRHKLLIITPENKHCVLTQSITSLNFTTLHLSLIHIWRCRRSTLCRSRWSPYH